MSLNTQSNHFWFDYNMSFRKIEYKNIFCV